MKLVLPFIFTSRSLLLAVCLACFALLATQGQAQAPKKPVWIINSNALNLLRKQDGFAQMESWFFDDPQTFVVGEAAKDLPHCVPTITFTSYASFKRAIEANSISPSIKAVMYDNEYWQFTPTEEQKDALTYMKSFGVLSHEKGLIYVVTPATNIVRAIDGQGPQQAYARYLNLGIAKAAAANADVNKFRPKDRKTIRSFSPGLSNKLPSKPAPLILKLLSSQG